MPSFKLLVGTSKGLVVFSITDQSAIKTEVYFKGLPVSMLYVDEYTHTWWVGLSHRHWGEKLHKSNDEGKSWEVAGLPSYGGYDYKPGQRATLKKLWVMVNGGKQNPNRLWLGTEPGGLFFSDDYGKSFHLNKSLWNHPTRLDDQKWFGTGKDFPFIHSIIVDPRVDNHVYVAVSCAGVFETLDGGQSWETRNTGLVAGYLPKSNADVGHDPHQMLMCHMNPNVLWQQNHCGIFRTVDGAKNWIDVSGKDLSTTESGSKSFPSYGFALAVDESNADVAWVIPAESDESRVPVGLKLQVMKTVDDGKTWISKSKGLPDKNCFDLALRHGFVRIPGLMAFGTTNGNLYCSFDDGEQWQTLSQNLAPVSSLALVQQ